jgi:SAM-dependent methyltransferase
MTADPAIAYERADLERLSLPEARYDLAYSSLALHYIAGLAGLLATVHRTLKPGGWLVFSCEHPLFTAPSRPGWVVDAGGRRTWPLDGYLSEGPRRTDWIAQGVIKQHRSVATYLSLVIQAGFALAHVEEWGPSDAQIAAHPDWAKERDRPPFLLVAARR